MENSSHHLRNMGDLAMLRTAIIRLRAIWPDARIDVVTAAPETLMKYCPDVFPLEPEARRIWLNSRHPDGAGIRGRIGGRLLPKLKHLLRMKPVDQSVTVEGAEQFVEAVGAADLVMASGGGFITDAFEDHAGDILDIIGLGVKQGKATALLGQGIGPVSSTMLFGKAAAVLPSIDLISLRESKNGLRVLSKCNVAPEHIMTTGDDAIESAWEARSELPGSGIGINLRMARYSEIGTEQIAAIRRGIHTAAKRHNAPLIPLPISFVNRESDVATIRQIFKGYPAEMCLPEPQEDLSEVLAQVGLCRIIITGSYHCAVFGLAQGIPAICLAESQYYKDKFSGLADQFGCGVETVVVNDTHFEENLRAAAGKMWALAEELRPLLFEAACRQIEAGKDAYRRIQTIVEQKNCKQGGPERERKAISHMQCRQPHDHNRIKAGAQG